MDGPKKEKKACGKRTIIARARRSARSASRYGYVNLSVSDAISKHQHVAIESLRKELSQMYYEGASGEDLFKVWKPVLESCVTAEQRRNLVYSVMFLKETNAEGILTVLKSRLIAAEVKKRFGLLVGGEGSLPTVDFTSVMYITTIARREKRHSLSFDVKGAYLNCNMKRLVLRRLNKDISKNIMRDVSHLSPIPML